MSHTRDWRANFDCMVGRTIVRIEGASSGSECITFTADNGDYFNLLHVQDCCESVSVEDICGDVDDLIGAPILMAEEAFDSGEDQDYGSSTWTFYKLATIKGSVTIRWFGSSNGYYGETATFEKWEADKPIIPEPEPEPVPEPEFIVSVKSFDEPVKGWA